MRALQLAALAACWTASAVDPALSQLAAGDAMPLDDECIPGDEAACALNALQRKTLKTHTAKKKDPFDDVEADDTYAEQKQAMHAEWLNKKVAERYNKNFTLRGKTIYFLLLDRFARTDGDTTPCEREDKWCGGTIKGVISKLDYIKGMGFDCIWITPPVKQFQGLDPTNNCTGFMGYWAYDFYDVDPHYGTKADLKQLAKELHARDMCFVLDIVVNHVGPLLSEADVAKIYPFNKTEYFNQLGKKPGDSFDDYTKCLREPPHVLTDNCTTPVPFTKGLGSPVPDNLPFCGVGDDCPGYDQEIILDGWFYSLGDLNYSHPAVSEMMADWAVWMVETYDVDAIRLDTAAFVPSTFLEYLQYRVDVEILGEVTTTKESFHSMYMSLAGPDGLKSLNKLFILKGMLNFPLGMIAAPTFCGGDNIKRGNKKGWPGANFNLTRLGKAMEEQYETGLYQHKGLLGNFVDNHDDQPRIGYSCIKSKSRKYNSLAWLMFTQGIPIVYYGTEQGMDKPNDFRSSMWDIGYDENAELYKFFKVLNGAAKIYFSKLENAEQDHTRVKHHDANTLIFTRGGDYGLWVFVNNHLDTDGDVTYAIGPPPAPAGKAWSDALSMWWAGHPEKAQISQHVNAFAATSYSAKGSWPKVLVLVDESELSR